MSTTAEEQHLADRHRCVHRALIDAVLLTGNIPPVLELADQLCTTSEAVRESLDALAAADYLAREAGGQITCLYPFSTTVTGHVVRIEAERRFAMCAIDALGVPAMLNRELDLESRCAICTTPITVRVRPGAITSVMPLTAMVVARRVEDEPAFAACCPFTVFVCGQGHAGQFMRRIPGAHALSLDAALVRGEEIFGDLMANAVPARRTRGRRWEQVDDA